MHSGLGKPFDRRSSALKGWCFKVPLVMFPFLAYLAIHSYTDIKEQRTSNKVNLIALIVLVVLSCPENIKPVITALLWCLVIGLILEKLGVWMPGDTRMFSICGGYTALLGVPVALYAAVVLIGYAVVGIFLLGVNKQLGMPNLLAVIHPVLRDKGVRFPGAPLLAASSLLSLGVIIWK